MNLSVVTISFNAENEIEKTMISVLNQSIPVYEYILVDGGSTDRTCEIIQSYESRFRERGVRVKFKSEKDRGISDAFNKGITWAEGDFIGLINAGDELHPDACRELQAFLEKETCDVVYGNCIWMDEKNNLQYVKKPGHNLNRLYYDFILIHSSVFVSKAAYDRYGLFDISYKLCMDKELLCRMYDKGAKFSYLDKELSTFSAGGVSDLHPVAVMKEGIRISNSYNKPKIITYSNVMRKLAKHYSSRVLKKTPLYHIIKKKK